MPFEPLSTMLLDVIDFINGVLVPVILALAFLAFMWGVFRYFIAGGASEEGRSEGKTFAIWSIIAFVVIFSVWGIVNLLMTTLGFNSNTRPCLPTFDGGCKPSSVESSAPSGGSRGLDQACTADSQCQSGSCGSISDGPITYRGCVAN